MLLLLVLEDDCCVVTCVRVVAVAVSVVAFVGGEWVGGVRTYVRNEQQKMTSS
jgi:hypothetical protein